MILDYSNLFIVFPGGCGGNHISNMLSLLPQFTKRLTTLDNYSEVMLNKYIDKNLINSKHKTAHIYSELINLQTVSGTADIKLQRLKNSVQDDSLIKIFLAHHHMLYDWGQIEEYYDNTFFLTMTWPTMDSLPGKRSLSLYGSEICDWSSDNYSFEGLNRPSPGSNLNWSLNVPKSNYLEIDTELFWKEDGCDYLEKSLNLILPDTAKTMHTMWLSWFKHL
jgi:hypothetical protein